jgi:hypothetical protein
VLPFLRSNPACRPRKRPEPPLRFSPTEPTAHLLP